MELTHKQLPDLFKGIRPSIISGTISTYYLHQEEKDILAIYWLGDNEWRFIQGFSTPDEKKVFSTNFPITTTERFIQEMKHIGIYVELK